MIKRTIERVRSASSWMLNPACLIDRLLDQIDKLHAVLVVPAQAAGVAHSEAHVDVRLD